MYQGIKSLISMDGTTSDFINCNVGVRQGENLSPFLFSLYISDLENFLLDKNIEGLKSISDAIENEIFMYMKLFILFYADDTVIMTETAEDLQNALNEFYLYFESMEVTSQYGQNKIFDISKGPLPKNVFYYNKVAIENVKDFKYLGIIVSRTGSFPKAKKHLCEQAQKAIYSVIRKIRQFNLPVDCQFELFDKIVVPVLLYGCEIWGYENIEVIERVHLKF